MVQEYPNGYLSAWMIPRTAARITQDRLPVSTGPRTNVLSVIKKAAKKFVETINEAQRKAGSKNGSSSGESVMDRENWKQSFIAGWKASKAAKKYVSPAKAWASAKGRKWGSDYQRGYGAYIDWQRGAYAQEAVKDAEKLGLTKGPRIAAPRKRKASKGKKPGIDYYTVLIPWSDTPTPWHPIEKTGPFAILSRGAFSKRSDAVAWADRELLGQPYEIRVTYKPRGNPGHNPPAKKGSSSPRPAKKAKAKGSISKRDKERMYELGLYMVTPPPVTTAAWDRDTWIRYIDKSGKWNTAGLRSFPAVFPGKAKGNPGHNPKRPFSVGKKVAARYKYRVVYRVPEHPRDQYMLTNSLASARKEAAKRHGTVENLVRGEWTIKEYPGSPKRRGGVEDIELGDELKLWIDTSSEPIYLMINATARNLINKMAAGKYDRSKARKAFLNVANAAAKQYVKDNAGAEFRGYQIRRGPHGSFGPFSTATRDYVAGHLLADYDARIGYGEYDHYLAQKYKDHRGQRLPWSGPPSETSGAKLHIVLRPALNPKANGGRK